MVDLQVTTNTGGQSVLSEAAVQDIQATLRGELLRPSDDGYDEARKEFETALQVDPVHSGPAAREQLRRLDALVKNKQTP